jgi:DNA-binding helix-hairpin-helix protein with protein kinase domain
VVLPPIMSGTTDYMAPEIVAAQMRGIRDIRPSIQTDLHSLAVLIYQLLLMRHPLRGPKVHDPKNPERDEQLALGEKALYTEDPDDRSNRPEDPFRGAWLLGEEVESLMRRAFTDGLRDPSKRPIAAAWHEALMRMADQHVPCFNPACEGKAFILLRDHPAVCPWCNTQAWDRLDIFSRIKVASSSGATARCIAGTSRAASLSRTPEAMKSARR